MYNLVCPFFAMQPFVWNFDLTTMQSHNINLSLKCLIIFKWLDTHGCHLKDMVCLGSKQRLRRTVIS